MSLKDATTFGHLNEMNYKEWRPNVLNLLNSHNYSCFIKKDYHPLIHRSHLYQMIKEQELFSFLLASTAMKIATSMIDACVVATAKQIKVQAHIKELTLKLHITVISFSCVNLPLLW